MNSSSVKSFVGVSCYQVQLNVCFCLYAIKNLCENALLCSCEMWECGMSGKTMWVMSATLLSIYNISCVIWAEFANHYWYYRDPVGHRVELHVPVAVGHHPLVQQVQVQRLRRSHLIWKRELKSARHRKLKHLLQILWNLHQLLGVWEEQIHLSQNVWDGSIQRFHSICFIGECSSLSELLTFTSLSSVTELSSQLSTSV